MNNYYEIFPETCKILGDQAFQEVISSFSDENSSECTFEEILGAHSECQQFPFIIDIARLEFALYNSYTNRAEEFVLDVDSLLEDLQKRPQSICLTLSPSLHFIESQWPILDLYQMSKNNEQKLDTIEKKKDRYYYIINTIDSESEGFEISHTIYLTLEKLKEGPTLEEVADTVFKDASVQELEDVLKTIITSGMIFDYQIKEELQQ